MIEPRIASRVLRMELPFTALGHRRLTVGAVSIRVCSAPQREDRMADGIESHLNEQRVFPPPAEFAARAQLRSMDDYEALYRQAADDPDSFWRERAAALDWIRPW